MSSKDAFFGDPLVEQLPTPTSGAQTAPPQKTKAFEKKIYNYHKAWYHTKSYQ